MSEQNKPCPICDRVAEVLKDRTNPFLIHEFPNSLFVVGEHQFYEGYTQLLFKDHVTEMHALGPRIQSELFAELMSAAKAVAAAFEPWKMNYSCYGNVVPHIHWHLFPRSAADPDRLQVPWHHAADFGKHLTDQQTALDVSKRIKAHLLQP